MKKTLLALFIIISFVCALAMMPAKEDPTLRFHTEEEIVAFTQKIFNTALDSGQYFHMPVACKGCHGMDSLGLANVDANGMDVNLYDDWETSMMGLSAVDPFWKAKVKHEMLVNPGHSNQLQTLCTSCHAPMGHYTARYNSQTYYTLADLASDSLGQAGVGCMGCHSIGTNGLGDLFSGEIPYDTTHVAYGPFFNPMAGPMQLYVGLTPLHSDHVSESRFCSSCHTLIANTVDLNGVPTGTTFIEQATYHEWQNSDYPAQSITCQSCHMPELEDPIKIANGYIALPGRSPFNLHSFAGANSFMVKLIKNNKAALGVTARDENFDSTLTSINKLLTESTLIVEASNDTIANDTAYISVTLTNKAGHKFPTGYPSRRAVLQFVATNAADDTVFASGLFDSNHEVVNIDSTYEQHYDVINDPSQVQIYEMVMGDVNGNKTSVLERGYNSLKDNRLPPVGFTTIANVYDTCAIIGQATTDIDFNKINGIEGSGKDVVKYHIPLNGYSGTLNISATVYYQTLPASFLTEMFTYQAAEIDSFRQYFEAEDNSPLFIAGDTLQNIFIPAGINDASALQFNISPSISNNGKITVRGENLLKAKVHVYTDRGQLVSVKINSSGRDEMYIELPAAAGIYFIRISTNTGEATKKVLRL